MISYFLPTALLVSGALMVMLATGLDVDWSDANRNGVADSHATAQKHEIPVDPKLLCRRELRHINEHFGKSAADNTSVRAKMGACLNSLPAPAP